MSLQQIFYGVTQPIVNQTNAGVNSLSGSISGGSGPGPSGPNLEVSTLTVNDSGNITLDWNNGGATLNFGFEATNTSSFILQQGIGVSGTKVAGPDGCLQVLEKDGGTNQVFAPLQASGFEVCATAYPGGAFAGLYFSTIGSVLYSAVGQPLTIDAPAGVSVSSLTVSSINGQSPSGGGGGPTLGTSSITTSTITCPADQNSGLTFGGASFTNPVGIAATPLTGQYGNTSVIGAWGKEVYQGNPGFGEFAAQRYYVTDVQGGATNATLIQNVGNQIQIQTTSSISLQAQTFVTGSFNTSSINVSSINGQPAGTFPQNITASTITVSTINGAPVPNTALYTFNGYNQGGNACTLDPKTNWLSLVNGYGQLNLLFPDDGTGGWVGNTKFWDLSQLSVASGPGGQPFASGCVIAGVSLAAVNNNTGVSQLQSWYHPGTAQLDINASESGTVSSFSVMANITF